MALDAYTARLSANQSSNLALGNHVQFDLDDGAAVAIVSTGAGQLSGLITMQATGIFLVEFSFRMVINEGTCQLELYDDTAGTPLLDLNGQNLLITTTDNDPTNECEHCGASSIFSLTAGDTIKVEFTLSQNPVTIAREQTALSMLRLG